MKVHAIFAAIKQLAMLGVRDSHTPLRGEPARRFLEKIARVQTGHLNDEDRKEVEAIERQRKEARWQIVWDTSDLMSWNSTRRV